VWKHTMFRGGIVSVSGKNELAFKGVEGIRRDPGQGGE